MKWIQASGILHNTRLSFFMKGVNSYLRHIDLHCYMKWNIGQQKNGNMTKHWEVYVKMDLWTNNYDKSRIEHIQGNM